MRVARWLSGIVMSVLLLSPAQAITLQEALLAGKIGGEIKFMYLDASDTSAKAAKGTAGETSAAAALHLNYVSGDFYGFKLGASFEGSHDFDIDEDDPDPRLAYSDTKLSQVYLQYSYKENSLKVGRQYLSTPLIKTCRIWAMYDSFDAAVFTTKLIPDTVLTGIYLKEWNTTWANREDIHFEDPIYSLYIQNKSLKGLTLTGQYLTTDNEGSNGDPPAATTDGYDVWFSQGDYKLPINYPVTLSLQYGGAAFDKDDEDSTYFWGAKVATEVLGVGLEAAYASVADDNDFPGTLGQGANAAVFNHMLINTSIFAGLDSASIKASYDFSKVGAKGLNASLMYTYFMQSDEGMVDGKSARDMDNSYEIDADIHYALSGILKGLSTRIWAGYANYDLSVPADVSNADRDDDVAYIRWYVDYRF